MHTPKNVPIIIPCFNRPEFLEQCLNNLKNCNLIEQFEVFFSIDTKELNTKNGQEVVNICENWIYSPRTIFLRDNVWHGSLNSTGAIGFVMKKIGATGGFIYIEDDVIVSECFLEFCLDCINFYNDNKYVMKIAGHNMRKKDYNEIIPRNANLIEKCTCSILLGVAGWWNRWKWIDENLENFCKDASSIKDSLFNNCILPKINCHVRDNGNMRNLSGGGLITANMMIDGRICLVPDISLADHIGWYGWHIPKGNVNSNENNSYAKAETFHKLNCYNKNFPIISKVDVAKSFGFKEFEIKDSKKLK